MQAVTRQWTRANWWLWGVMAFLALGVGFYAWHFLLGPLPRTASGMSHHLPGRAWALYTHFALGGAALILGPFQFVHKIREAKPRVHHWVGRIYVSCAFLASISGFVMALHAQGGLVTKSGFALLAIMWFAATAHGLFLVLKGRYAEHRRWMIRSYALCYAAVTLRIYLPLFLAGFGWPFPESYAAISFLCWVPNLAFAEWFVRRFP